MISLGFFSKDFDHEIFTQRTEVRDANGVLTEIRTIPINTGSARVRGFELTAIKRHLDFLPGPFSRFGVQRQLHLSRRQVDADLHRRQHAHCQWLCRPAQMDDQCAAEL